MWQLKDGRPWAHPAASRKSLSLITPHDLPIYSYGPERPGSADAGNNPMIPILLLDLAGVILVIGYVLLDRRHSATGHGPNADQHDPAQTAAGSPPLPIEPIVAQRPLPPGLEPRRIKRPQRGEAPGRQADADRPR